MSRSTTCGEIFFRLWLMVGITLMSTGLSYRYGKQKNGQPWSADQQNMGIALAAAGGSVLALPFVLVALWFLVTWCSEHDVLESCMPTFASRTRSVAFNMVSRRRLTLAPAAETARETAAAPPPAPAGAKWWINDTSLPKWTHGLRKDACYAMLKSQLSRASTERDFVDTLRVCHVVFSRSEARLPDDVKTDFAQHAQHCRAQHTAAWTDDVADKFAACMLALAHRHREEEPPVHEVRDGAGAVAPKVAEDSDPEAIPSPPTATVANPVVRMAL